MKAYCILSSYLKIQTNTHSSCYTILYLPCFISFPLSKIPGRSFFTFRKHLLFLPSLALTSLQSSLLPSSGKPTVKLPRTCSAPKLTGTSQTSSRWMVIAFSALGLTVFIEMLSLLGFLTSLSHVPPTPVANPSQDLLDPSLLRFGMLEDRRFWSLDHFFFQTVYTLYVIAVPRLQGLPGTPISPSRRFPWPWSQQQQPRSLFRSLSYSVSLPYTYSHVIFYR